MSLEIWTITHTASRASFRIHPIGATVLSYTNGAGRSVIFVSQQAKLDGSIPIRGGIPIVFPIFGPPKSGTMPQHGYARRNLWRFMGSYDTEECAGARFALKFSDVKHGLGSDNDWADGKNSCTLVFTAECTASTITTTLEIQNTGSSGFPFQALQHTYFNVVGKSALQPDQCFVTGLMGYTVTDKVTKTSTQVNDVEKIIVDGEVDRVYDPPDGINEVNVKLRAGTDGALVEITASGMVDGTNVPISCVVWNPHADKAMSMADFGDEEYLDMVCVEPGILGDKSNLDAGKTATLTQSIKLQSSETQSI